MESTIKPDFITINGARGANTYLEVEQIEAVFDQIMDSGHVTHVTMKSGQKHAFRDNLWASDVLKMAVIKAGR